MNGCAYFQRRVFPSLNFTHRRSRLQQAACISNAPILLLLFLNNTHLGPLGYLILTALQ